MWETYTFIGRGRHREVYRLNDNEVFKVPMGTVGEEANTTEAYLFERDGHDGVIPYAACRLGTVEGVRVLIMDYVQPAQSVVGLPDWTLWVDCQQVGHDPEGRLVAYDFAG